jgi:NAD(P)-dependent dehydrogenase (short-subunit alcohol dehydrogenase family)
VTARGERLAGKIALVTGAGQTPGVHIGNGRAVAQLFAREGADVALMDLDPESAAGTAELVEAAGGRALVVSGDVSAKDDCTAAIAAVVEHFGGIDILHHNVGIGTGDGWAEWIEPEAWQRIMSVNAGGALFVAGAALPALKGRGGGAITFVSSIASVVAGQVPMSSPPLAYKMSKAAMNSLTQALAQTYAPEGIRVNAILPGLVDTPMGVDAVAELLNIPREQYAAARDESVPLKGGMGTAWDVAYAALYLASDEARFVTGVLLPVDGGSSSRVG